jgi:hypothetical protein
MTTDAGPIGPEKGGDGMATTVAVLATALLVATLVIDRLAR